jgi:hypothetical protein
VKVLGFFQGVKAVRRFAADSKTRLAFEEVTSGESNDFAIVYEKDIFGHAKPTITVTASELESTSGLRTLPYHFGTDDDNG